MLAIPVVARPVLRGSGARGLASEGVDQSFIGSPVIPSEGVDQSLNFAFFPSEGASF